MKNCSVIGLGKLGACTASCLAAKGFKVIGVDISKNVVDSINEGKAPVEEPRLQECIDASEGRLTATQSYEEVIRDTDVTFLIVPTPSRQDGHFSDRYLKDALGHLAAALKISSKESHLFVISSTVSPGTIDESIVPLIESRSGRKVNVGFSVCYNPEFIALGNVITDFLNPDMVLIGESDTKAGDTLQEIYKQICENKPYVARMSVVSAEITKISLNSYVTMKISFANTLANICEYIEGAEVDNISKALGADKRISPYYLKGGLNYGGPCFPRDNRAFSAFTQKFNYSARLALATDDVNRYQVRNIVKRILHCIDKGEGNIKGVSFLGLAYKPNTPVIEESPAVLIIEELLKKRDVEVIVYDELAGENAKVHFGENVLYASNIKDCFVNSAICVITLPTKEFQHIDKSVIVHDPTTIIDCWRILDPEKLGERVTYLPLGKWSSNE